MPMPFHPMPARASLLWRFHEPGGLLPHAQEIPEPGGHGPRSPGPGHDARPLGPLSGPDAAGGSRPGAIPWRRGPRRFPRRPRPSSTSSPRGRPRTSTPGTRSPSSCGWTAERSATAASRWARPSSSPRWASSGIEVSELFPDRAARRRHGGHPLDVHGHPGARGGDGLHEHRLAAHRQAEHGRVGRVRPGHREPEPARVHLAAQRRASPGRRGQLRRGVPAGRLPGHRASTRRRRPCSR